MTTSNSGFLSSAEQGERAERPRRFRHLRAILGDEERRHRALFVSGLVVIGTIAGLAYGTYIAQALPFDLRATSGLQRLGGPTFRLMWLVSWPGYSPQNAWIGIGAVLLVAWRLGWRDGAFLAALTGLQGLSNHLIKTAIGRPRPTDSLVQVFLPNHGNSFPSGHVMFYTVFFGFLFFLAVTRMGHTRWRFPVMALTLAMVLLVGPSRIYLGAHWLSDVVAGHLLALLILLFGIEIYVHYLRLPAEPDLATDEEPT